MCWILALFLLVSQDPTPARITLQARAEQPGELVILTVETSASPRAVTGTAFDTEVHFFQRGKPTIWEALVGIDVEVEPGEYPIEVKVELENGAETHQTRMLRVSRRVFPSRYLTLPEKYVNPPEAVQERIRRETEEVKAIFSNVSPERFWTPPFRRPVPGVLLSTFGKRSVLNGQPRSIHAGIDLRAGLGTPLRAPAAGRVVLAKELYFAGNSIILDHGLGLYSQFAHLSALRVKEGQVVRRGEIIALTGRSGRVQGPHLHWSVRVGNSRIDPLAVLALLGTGKTG